MSVKTGIQNDDIINLQKRLTKWGFFLIADGIFGVKTEAALIDFQKAMGLKIDGILGPKSNAALAEDIINVTHFKKEEFECPCRRYCDGYLDINDKFGGINYALLILLERLRRDIGRKYGRIIPCNISSNGGYRCPKYNLQVGGASKSQHIFGNAADVFFKGVRVSVVNSIAKSLNPYGGLGLNGSHITHLDVRGYRSRWYYN